jgi:hypothetical protein
VWVQPLPTGSQDAAVKKEPRGVPSRHVQGLLHAGQEFQISRASQKWPAVSSKMRELTDLRRHLHTSGILAFMIATQTQFWQIKGQFSNPEVYWIWMVKNSPEHGQLVNTTVNTSCRSLLPSHAGVYL